jgi:hypothetical protein
MNRREFLKVGSVFSAAFFLTFGPIKGISKLSVEAIQRGKIYRGTSDGKVFVSENGGKSWRLQTSFGPEYSITDIIAGKDGQVYLQLGYQFRSFHLKLADKEDFWETVPRSSSMLANLV